jgi:hypothetical protein
VRRFALVDALFHLNREMPAGQTPIDIVVTVTFKTGNLLRYAIIADLLTKILYTEVDLVSVHAVEFHASGENLNHIAIVAALGIFVFVAKWRRIIAAELAERFPAETTKLEVTNF